LSVPVPLALAIGNRTVTAAVRLAVLVPHLLICVFVSHWLFNAMSLAQLLFRLDSIAAALVSNLNFVTVTGTGRLGRIPYWTIMHHLRLPHSEFSTRLFTQIILGDSNLNLKFTHCTVTFKLFRAQALQVDGVKLCPPSPRRTSSNRTWRLLSLGCCQCFKLFRCINFTGACRGGRWCH
jgi:hypothetical protein